ncbi:MAG: response regulator [Magnetococcales bacterium]|nr:response regulator [Magnetococcales bacterium]
MSLDKKKPVILIVDDEITSLAILKGILSSEYELRFAIQGSQALDMALNNRLDLILLDITMPEMDGYELIKQLKSSAVTRDIPVIFITARDGTDDEHEGLSLGAVDYITKPVNASITRARVATALTQSLYRISLANAMRRTTAQRLVLSTGTDRLKRELLGESVEALSMLHRAAMMKDNETSLHIARTSQYVEMLALEIGLGKRIAGLVMLAAPMHDIGKIGIPDSILLKSSDLSDEEWPIMRGHVMLGAQIIGEHPENELYKFAMDIVLTHHERWDGYGYPHGLKGQDIPLVGRIMALADVFDALTSTRPYKPAWPLEAAVREIKNNRSFCFDPVLVTKFLKKVGDGSVEKIMNQFKDDI